MTATSSSAEDQPRNPVEPEAVDGGNASLLATSTAARCTVCSAELTLDQRYCIECGTRRGQPRFTLAPAAGGRTTGTAVTAAAPAPSQRLVILLGAILVAVAIGVGVLIGNAGKASPVKGPITVVLSGQGAVQTSGSGTSTAATNTTAKATTTTGGTSTTSTTPANGDFFGS